MYCKLTEKKEVGKFVPKFRHHNDDYLDDYNSTKEFNRNKKQKKEAAELRRMRQRKYEDDEYGYLEKRYGKL
jgi:hypothetical protein